MSELKLMRLERGLDVREAAKGIGISKSTLDRLEKTPDLSTAHAGTLAKVARFYRREVRDIIHNSDHAAALACVVPFVG